MTSTSWGSANPQPKRLRFLLMLTFIVLGTGTALFASFFERYRPIGPELLSGPGFQEGAGLWWHYGPPGSVGIAELGTIRLSSNDCKGVVGLSQSVAEAKWSELLLLAGEIKTLNVNAGKKVWQKARIVLSRHDKAGNWVPVPHELVALDGSHHWKDYAQVFRVAPNAEELRVSAQLPHASGTMWVRNLSLKKACEKPAFGNVRLMFVGLWACFIAWLLAPFFFECRHFFSRSALFLLLSVICLGMLIPGDLRVKTQEKLSAQIYQFERRLGVDSLPAGVVSWDTERLEKFYVVGWRVVTKFGHFMLFGLFSAFLLILFPSFDKIHVLLDVLMLAGATEFLQFFVDNRSPLLGDFLIDTSGATVGLVLAMLFVKKHYSDPKQFETATSS